MDGSFPDGRNKSTNKSERAWRDSRTAEKEKAFSRARAAAQAHRRRRSARGGDERCEVALNGSCDSSGEWCARRSRSVRCCCAPRPETLRVRRARGGSPRFLFFFPLVLIFARSALGPARARALSRVIVGARRRRAGSRRRLRNGLTLPREVTRTFGSKKPEWCSSATLHCANQRFLPSFKPPSPTCGLQFFSRR